MILLSTKLIFPPPEVADEDGILCMGGDLSTERLLLAYRSGIFPWYNGDLPIWWNPDPRFVLQPTELKISKSMKQVLKRGDFTITKNNSFLQVINNCMQVERREQDGTWINDEVIIAYHKLHQLGFAVSYEAWQNEQLVGGFYGIRMGAVFFGESMFSKVSNASKAAFITAVGQMKQEGLELIDCQIHSEHLESLGAKMIPRSQFLDLLTKWLPKS